MVWYSPDDENDVPSDIILGLYTSLRMTSMLRKSMASVTRPP